MRSGLGHEEERAAWTLSRLIVVYDERCELCRRCRAWLESQAQLTPLVFAAAGDPAVVTWAGDAVPVGDELVVVADDGSTWVGPDAFLVCLWALRDHRRTAARLQRPSLRPLARQLLHAFSVGRGLASSVLAASPAAADLESLAASASSDSAGFPDSSVCSSAACKP